MTGWKRIVPIACLLAVGGCDHAIQGVGGTPEERAVATAEAMVTAVTEEYARLRGVEVLPHAA